MGNYSNSYFLNNKTMAYRINNFADACGMIYVDASDIEFIYDFYEMGKDFILIKYAGQYDNLSFCFINSIHVDMNLDKKVRNLRFAIDLTKKIDTDIYKLNIGPRIGKSLQYKFELSKKTKDKNTNNNISFYSFVTDFDKILKLVKSFVDNPDLTLDSYNEIMEEENKKTLNKIFKGRLKLK